MGLFSSKWKMYAGQQTQNIYDDKKAYTTVEDIILKGTIQKERVGKLISKKAVVGTAVDLQRAFRYGKSTYAYGLPDITISVGSLKDGQITGDDLDELVHIALESQCKKMGVDYSQYRGQPHEALPLEVEMAEYVILNRKLLEEEPEEFKKGMYFCYMASSSKMFKDADTAYQEVVFNDSPLDFGLKKWREYYKPKDPETETQEVTIPAQYLTNPPPEEENPPSTEIPWIPIGPPIYNDKPNPLANRRFTILPEQLSVDDVEEVYDGIYKCQFKATEIMFAHLQDPEPVYEESDYDDTMFVYQQAIEFNATREIPVTYVSGISSSWRTSTTTIKLKGSSDDIFIRETKARFIIPSNVPVRKSEKTDFIIRKNNTLSAVASTHPYIIDSETMPTFEVPSDAKVVVSFNPDDVLDVHTFDPFSVVVREGTIINMLRLRFTESKLNNPNTFTRPYDFGFIQGADESDEDDLGPVGNPPPIDNPDFMKAFPAIPFMSKRGWEDKAETTSELARQLRQMGRILNIDIKKIAAEIRKSAGGDEQVIQYAYMNFGSDPTTNDPETKQYLFEYLKFLEERSIYGINNHQTSYAIYLARLAAWEEDDRDSIKKGRRPRFNPPNNIMSISEPAVGYWTRINWGYVVETFYQTPNRTRKLGSVTIEGTSTTTRNRIISVYGSIPPSGVMRTFTRQEELGIREYTIVGLGGSRYINSWRQRDGGEWHPMEWGNKNKAFIFPFIYGIWRSTLLLGREAASSRSYQLTITTAQWVKKKGWVRVFQVVMIIVMIVMIAFAIGSFIAGALQASAGGVAGAAGGALANASIGGMIKTMLIQLIESKLAGFILEKIGDALGLPWLGMIAKIAQTFSGDFTMDFQTIMSLTTDLAQGIGKSIQTKIDAIANETQKLIADFEAQMAEVEAKEEELANSYNIAPDKLLELIIETPNQFFERAETDVIEALEQFLEVDLTFNLDQYLIGD